MNNEGGEYGKMKFIRKNIALILSVMFMLSLVGCGSSGGVSEETASQTQATQERETVKDEEQADATVTGDTTSETEDARINNHPDSVEQNIDAQSPSSSGRG